MIYVLSNVQVLNIGLMMQGMILYFYSMSINWAHMMTRCILEAGEICDDKNLNAGEVEWDETSPGWRQELWEGAGARQAGVKRHLLADLNFKADVLAWIKQTTKLSICTNSDSWQMSSGICII